MKIAVLKGGANVTFGSNNSSAGNADILYALRVINPFANDITIVTHWTRNTQLFPVLKFQEILDDDWSFDDFDIVLLFNFSVNFFGGAENPSLTQLYRKLATSSVPIVYVQTDGNLPFKKFWPLVKDREWAKGWKESEFEIDENRIHYIQQGRDLFKSFEHLATLKDCYHDVHMYYYPWETTILHGYRKHFGVPTYDFFDRQYDLGYGGYTRNSYRRKRIEEFYSHLPDSTLLFGNLKLNNGMKAQGKTSYQGFIPRMKQCCATVIVGDQFYENNYFTLRMYESMLAGCLVLIDQRMDSNHRFYHNDSRFDKLYVNTGKEVANRIKNAGRDRMSQLAADAFDFITEKYDDHKEEQKLNSMLRSI